MFLKDKIIPVIDSLNMDIDSSALDSITFNTKNFYFNLSEDFNTTKSFKFFEDFLGEIYTRLENNELTTKNKKDIAALIEDILKASNHVYRQGELLISDEIFDGQEEITDLEVNSGKKHYYNLLLRLNENSELLKTPLLEMPLVDKDGKMLLKKETHPLGGKGTTLRKESVISGMKNSFEKLLKDNKVVDVSEKLDGSSLYLTYDNHGRLIKAVTRGDGIKGEDVTANALKIPSIPKTINVDGLNLGDNDNVQIRGEVIFMKDKFILANEKKAANNKSVFSNPRNSTAGAMRDLTGNYCEFLDFKAFEVLKVYNAKSEEESVERYGFNEREEFFEENHFLRAISWKVTSFEEYLEIYNNFENGTTRKDLNYLIDGLVVVGNGEFGVDDANKATYGFATKFTPIMDKTKIVDIEYNVESAGQISIVLLLEPLDIDGTIVSRVSFANKNSAGIQENLSTIDIGDEVIIAKMGDIIPKMLWNTKYEEAFKNIYKELKNTINIETFRGNPDNDTKYALGILEYIEKITLMKPNPENKDINIKFKTIISEMISNGSQTDFDLKNMITEILAEVMKNKVSEEQKEINSIEDNIKKFKRSKNSDKVAELSALKKEKQDELKALKVSMKQTNTEVSKKIKNIDKVEISVPVSEEHNKVVFNESCPKCGHSVGPLEKETKTVLCINPNCEGVILSTLERYAQTIGGKGIHIGRKTVEFLNNKGILNKFADYYSIKKEDFLDEDGKYFEGWKEQSINNLLESIDKLRTTEDVLFFKGLNIREFSESSSRTLFQSISIEEILAINYESEEEIEILRNRLENIDGFGKLMASYLIDYMISEKENVLELLEIVDLTGKTRILSKEELTASEITIVLTGSIKPGSVTTKDGVKEWTDRKTLTKSVNKQILTNGSAIKISGSVSGNTDYVVSDDKMFENIVELVRQDRVEDALKMAESGTSKITKFLSSGNPITNVITTDKLIGILNGKITNQVTEETIDTKNINNNAIK